MNEEKAVSIAKEEVKKISGKKSPSLTKGGLDMKRKILVGMIVLLFLVTVVVLIVCGESDESSLIGVYRKPSELGIYAHNPVVYISEKTRYDIVSCFTPSYGTAGAFGTGQLFDGSTKIIIYGTKDKEGKLIPTSWIVYRMEKSKEGLPSTGWPLYKWRPLSKEEASKLDITKNAIKEIKIKLSPKSIESSSIREPGGIDFTSMHLNYITTFSNSGTQTFSYALKAQKAEKGDKIIEVEKSTDLSLNSFFIGLTLPESKFWVNLNPWEPDRIIDEDLRKTDIGRIMLEADLQMKKDFCKYKNPCESEIGKEYSRLLDEKGEDLIKECMNNHPDEIKDSKNVLFPVTTRHWIVPDNVEAYETDNEIYITNATLNIYSEPVYEHSTYEIVNQNAFFVSGACKDDLSKAAKEYGRYAKELEEEMILPLVVQEVNGGKNYSDLRCVYNSLALAQWYKNKYRYSPSIFTDFTDSKNLTDLESKSDWSAENIWRDYVKSFEEGEYQCWMNETKKETYREDDRIVTETITRGYSCGGVDFLDIEISNIGDMPSNLRDLTSEAVYSIFAKDGNDYYFGDGLYVFYEGGLERAGFEISKLIINPAKVKVGEPVTIEVDVGNVGNTQDTKTVNIEINGEIVGSKEVTLAPGEIVTLKFTQNQPEEGEYRVAVGEQTGDYTVVTPGFEAIFAIAGLLAVAYLFRRRKRK